MSNQVSIPGGPTASKARFGCFPAKIGAQFDHRLDEPLTLSPSNRLLRIGEKVHMSVQDITRHPELEKHIRWVCRSPHCTGKKYESKKALVAAHADNKTLERNEETHCFYAVASVPGVEEVHEKLGKDGAVITERVEPKKPSVMLLSDEE